MLSDLEKDFIIKVTNKNGIYSLDINKNIYHVDLTDYFFLKVI